ncbi:hypothetical protein ZWY2020_046571, partial [Hordeum vulgare]
LVGILITGNAYRLHKSRKSVCVHDVPRGGAARGGSAAVRDLRDDVELPVPLEAPRAQRRGRLGLPRQRGRGCVPLVRPDGEFRNAGLERSEALKKDLKWFSEQGHRIPEPSAADTRYEGHAFFCHFYNMYFGQSAGGRFTGKKITDKILNKKELEFYKWEVLQRIHARQWTNEQTILEQRLLSATSFHVWMRLQPTEP